MIYNDTLDMAKDAFGNYIAGLDLTFPDPFPSPICGEGSSSTEVFSGVGAPAVTPTVSAALYMDRNNGSLYEWYSSGWH